jgi:flagellar motor switch protein FliG
MTDNEVKLTGSQRAAIILLSVSEENATNIFALMNDEEIKEISHAMSNLGSIKPDMVNKILSQFTSDIKNDASFLGNIQTTEKLLEKAIGKDKVSALLDEIRGPQGKNTWEKLGNVNEEILASYLKNEYPQTAALVLSKITGEHAAKVIAILPEQFAFEVITRMLNLGSVKKEVIDRVEKILRSEFISTISKTQKQDSYQMMAEIFNRFDRNSSAKYMGLLETKFPDSAIKIKDLMFTFEDLESIDTKGIQTLMRAIDKSKLTIALKGASQEIKDLFIRNMSQRASRILLEEMESLGPIRVRDVDEAQTAIVNAAKELISKGEIEIAEDGKDEYIQ